VTTRYLGQSEYTLESKKTRIVLDPYLPDSVNHVAQQPRMSPILMMHKPHFDFYIASCDRQGGIYRYRIQEGEEIQQIGFTPLDRPMYLVSTKEQMYVLLRDPFHNNQSGLLICDIDSHGNLRPTSDIVSTKGCVACHHAVTDEGVYCVNYLSGSIIKMPNTVVTHKGVGATLPRQEAPHTHFICESPDGQYVLVTDLGLDTIFVYDKELHKVSETSVPLGHGPRHLALHSDGTTVFCVNELQSTVSVLDYHEGCLVLHDTVSVLPKDCTASSAAAAIRCINNTVYVSNRGHDSVSVLQYANGKLSFEKTIPTHGKGPRDFCIKDDYIIATNEVGNNVSVISLQDERLIASIDVKAPLCVICR